MEKLIFPLPLLLIYKKFNSFIYFHLLIHPMHGFIILKDINIIHRTKLSILCIIAIQQLAFYIASAIQLYFLHNWVHNCFNNEFRSRIAAFITCSI